MVELVQTVKNVEAYAIAFNVNDEMKVSLSLRKTESTMYHLELT